MPRESKNGSIYFNKERKNWIASYNTLDTETGKNKRNRKSFTTYDKARIFLNNFFYRKNDAIFIKNNSIPLNLLLKNILEKKYESNIISDHSYNRSNNTISQIEKSYIGKKDINEISSEEIQDYLNSLTSVYSNSVISKIKEQFNQGFKYAIKKDFLHKNPMDEVIRPKSKKTTKIVKALEVDEQQKLTDYLVDKNIESMPYKNALLIQLYMGTRIGETLALKSSDINLHKNIISISKTLTTDIHDRIVMGNKTKTYAGQRELPIPQFIKPYIIEQLEIAKDNPEHLLFITPNLNLVNKSTINHQLQKISNELNIPKISSHILRHTYGTRCIEAGMRAVALQRLMGHADISVTLNTYTSVFNKYKESELEKVNNYYISNSILKSNTKLLKSNEDFEK